MELKSKFRAGDTLWESPVYRWHLTPCIKKKSDGEGSDHPEAGTELRHPNI